MIENLPNRIIRIPEVISLTGFSKSTLSNRIKSGLFCPSISLGDRAVGFIFNEVNTVLLAMMAEQPASEIKQLVMSLINNRTSYNQLLA